MKTIYLVILLIFFFSSPQAQNLFQNGSAENYNSQFFNKTLVDSIFFWSDGNSGSCDVYSTKLGIYPSYSTGYQKPRTGFNYVAFAMDGAWSSLGYNYMYKEYPKIELSQPLQVNTTYRIRAFLSNTGCYYQNKDGIATDSFGFLFLTQDTVFPAYNQHYNINTIPQVNDTNGFYTDTAQWMEVGGTYTAQGGESFITMGDFKRYDLIPNYYIMTPYIGLGAPYFVYYLIDDVAIWPADTVPPAANAGADTTICRGGKARLGTHTYADYIYQWSPAETLSNDSGGVVWARPLQTTTYYLLATDDIYTKTTDSVTVFVNQCGQSDTIVCIETPFVLGNTQNPQWHYQWSPATDLSNDTLGMTTCNPNGNISYQLLITTPAGDTIAFDSTQILVSDCYYADAGIDSLICKGDTLVLGTHDATFVNYSWWPNYHISDTTQAKPSVWPDTSMYYHLHVVDSMGNSTQDSIFIAVQICISIDEKRDNSKMKVLVFPNPAHDYTTLQFNQALSQKTGLILYNALGQRVLQQYLNASEREFTIALKKLQAGAYLLELHDSNGLLARQRLLVQ